MKCWGVAGLVAVLLAGCAAPVEEINVPHVAARKPIIPKAPKAIPGAEVYDWRIRDESRGSAGMVRMDVSFSVRNISAYELQSVDVTMTINRRGTDEVIYKCRPTRLTEFVNERYHHQGSLLPGSKSTDATETFEIPSALWTTAVYLMVEVDSVKPVAGNDLHDPGHLMTFMQLHSGEEIIQRFEKDPSLLRVKSTSGENAAQMALQTTEASVVRYCEAHGCPLVKPGGSAVGLMTLAVASGRVDCLDYALRRGAAVDESRLKGITPLMIASALGLTESVDWLAKHGANLNLTDEDGQPAMSYAAWRICFNVVDQLIELGASTSYHDKHGVGLAHLITWTPTACVDFFDKWHLSVEDHAPGNPLTPALYAAENGSLPSVAYLAKHGANLNAKNANGQDVFQLARKSNTLGTEAFLIEELRDAGVPGY